MAERYRETDEEVQDVFKATKRYIFEGDEIDEPYDLRGLGVYAVISALRSIDEEIDSGQLTLTDEQLYRLHMSEYRVDLAVNGLLIDSPLIEDKKSVKGGGMQFFPFGHNTDRFRLPNTKDMDQLRARHSPDLPRPHLNAHKSNLRVATSKAARTNPDDVVGPVVVKRID